MPRLTAIDPATTEGKLKETFTTIEKSMGGKVPNILRTLANSPAALDGYLSFSGALARGVLRPPVREQIVLVVAQANGCDYSLPFTRWLARASA